MPTMPDRITLSLAKGWRMPENTRVVTRGTIFGNPWACDTEAAFWWPNDPKGPRWRSTHSIPRLRLLAHEAVSLYSGWLRLAWVPHSALPEGLTDAGRAACHAALDTRRLTILSSLSGLRGKNLACFCKPGCPCHASVLLELANA